MRYKFQHDPEYIESSFRESINNPAVPNGGVADAVRKVRAFLHTRYRYSSSCRADLWATALTSIFSAYKKFAPGESSKMSFSTYAFFWVRGYLRSDFRTRSREIFQNAADESVVDKMSGDISPDVTDMVKHSGFNELDLVLLDKKYHFATPQSNVPTPKQVRGADIVESELHRINIA